MPPDRKNGTSAPIVAPTSRSSVIGAPPHSRAERHQRRRRVGAAAAEPGLHRDLLVDLDHRVADLAARARAPSTARAAAFQTRLLASSGTPGVRHLSVNGPGCSAHTQRVVQLDRLEDRAQLVIAVGADAEHAQIEIDLGVRAHGELESFRSLGCSTDQRHSQVRSPDAANPVARSKRLGPRSRDSLRRGDAGVIVPQGARAAQLLEGQRHRCSGSSTSNVRGSSVVLISTSDSRSVRSAARGPGLGAAAGSSRDGRTRSRRRSRSPARAWRPRPATRRRLPQVDRCRRRARSPPSPFGNDWPAVGAPAAKPAAGDRRAQRVGPERHAGQRLDDLLGRRVAQHAILARQHQRAAAAVARPARTPACRTARSPRAAPAPARRSPRRSVRAASSPPPCPTVAIDAVMRLHAAAGRGRLVVRGG